MSMSRPLHIVYNTPTGSGKTFSTMLMWKRLLQVAVSARGERVPRFLARPPAGVDTRWPILVYSVPTKHVLFRIGTECKVFQAMSVTFVVYCLPVSLWVACSHLVGAQVLDCWHGGGEGRWQGLPHSSPVVHPEARRSAGQGCFGCGARLNFFAMLIRVGFILDAGARPCRDNAAYAVPHAPAWY
jgi:hypothetical protein